MNYKFIRLSIILLLFFAGLSMQSYAQSTMTDEQIMSFVQKETKNGSTQSQIATKLIQRGVNISQIRRVRDKYEKEKKDALGAKDLTGNNNSSKTRLRKSNDAAINKKNNIDDDYRLDINASNREREDMNKMKNAKYEEEMAFMFPDSIINEMQNQKKKEVFGRNIFNNKNLSFEPNMNIATPSNYLLGPGDAVFVDIWGASQKTVESTVSPDGTISIEGFGPVNVAGMTVAQANSHLRSTLGQRYSSSKVRLTVGQTKTIMINVMGEVKTPGTYTISAFSTVFHALYMAGGTNDLGTLRNIKVYRNNRLVTTVDIYDYILNGKLSGNIRLADNDVIVVGPYDCLVEVAGKAKRPMLYEMKKNESVGTVIKYAGGFTGDAYDKVVRLIRKSGGEYSIYSIDEFERNTFKVTDGDSITIDSLIPRYSNMVEIKGSVFRPGMYQMDGNIKTVRDLINNAGGLTEDAFGSHSIMHRRKKDRTLETMSIDIEGLLNSSVADIALRNEDILFIPTREDMKSEKTFEIIGEVVYPGTYEFSDNTTLEDLILQAGGLKDQASIVKVDIARRIRNKKATKSSNEVAKFFSFSLKDGFVIDGTSGFILEPFDEIFVRKSPGYVEQKHVEVEGEVTFNGTYSLIKKTQRLSDLIALSGGLTDNAYPEGARLERRLTFAEKLKQQQLVKLLDTGDSVSIKKLELGDTRYVGINLDKALQNPGNNQWDLVLQEGDKLIVPEYSNTVTVNGDVMYPNTVVYKEGAKLNYYIEQAGGYGLRAKKNRVFVLQMNGTVTRARSAKDIKPGSEIIVPSKKKRGGMSIAEIGALGTTAASLATVVAALLAL